MHEFSTIDGFVDLSECMADMLKYMANEPSTGLFFIQHHTQNSVPNLIKVKRNLAEKSHEITLHREDMEDSIIMVRSMQKCVFPIADEMIGEIKKSLATMTTKQPKGGLIHQLASSSQTEKTNIWRNTAFNDQGGNEKRSNYFSSVLKSAKQKASSFRWPQLDAKGSIDSMTEKPQMYPNLSVTSTSISLSLQGTEIDELPVSIQVEDESQHEMTDTSDIANKLLSVSGDIGSKLVLISENSDDFKANEAKLEECGEGARNLNANCGMSD
ncbi:hypothetical protein Lalb_Chr02g0152071 [Lupinus albus]|uniref:Uncharacterized protein n=1 Tax=Lupinus albus TaxID=3870 RepID=A0A6A4QZY8_LUPAL|nr:hypothetical protein Lalb_Chr02g0152071 [Lupinus albus]